MNCKKGDVAVIVSSSPPSNIGLLVDVIDVAPIEMFIHQGVLYESSTDPTWIVRSKGRGMAVAGLPGFVTERPFVDRCLRPIRDQPGEDETPEWAPVPGEKVTA